ncbi:hypothetical protein ES288_D12G066900v1 [Gossypium darwinii]|uniref:MULE transposase domain-containing protein n=1 Tax=Gossypium darwinii TaxID=34276 RepID=A0A5D2A6P0_GOSDA|nr:hypothetical protein ES288_D12G066900v1 [Gossypium darwinii]
MATSPFFTDRVFESCEELMQWVQNTAFSLGYIIVTRRSKAKENGVVSYVTLICDRGGEYKFKESSKKSGTKKTNCKFRLVGSVICDQHNHPPAQHMEGHAYARWLKENKKKLLVDLTSKNATPRDILSTLKEQDENNVSTQKTIYNARQKLHSSWNVSKTPIQVLMLLLNDKQFFTEFSINNISNELENLFFIHPRSLDIWRAFPHVLIVDATYKTNKYDLPFVQIVGVTSTNKTFSIAFAFIINEKEEKYNWALTCLKLTLEECMYPRVTATDREFALMNACQQVFPDITRLLYSFRAMWTVLVESPTWILYTKNYKKLQSMLSEYPGVLKYLDQVWLSKYKEIFVVESQHAKLKKYLSAKNFSLDKFVGCIDQIVKSQLTSIYESFEKSRIILKHKHNLPCFRLLWGFVALEALDIIEGELQWKLDLSPSTSVENEDICCDGELELFKENFTKQSKKQQQKQVDSISQAPRRRSHSTTSKSSVGLDLVELNKEPARHSSYVIKIPNLNQEPSEQVSDFIDLNQMSESCNTHPLMKEIPDICQGDGNCGFRAISVCLGYGKDQWLYVRHQLLDELLNSYDIYAKVFTDGIDELRNSLCFSESLAPAEHWMVMPMTGVLIANKGDYPMPTILAYWICHRAPSTAG